jgi:hypothetical protein
MKLKFGALIVDGSGKIGGQVVSSNRGGKYLRTKVTPSNPSTVAQQNARALLSSLSTQWADLTEAQRLSFNSAVSNFATTDIFGDLKNPSGFNLFVKLNANLSNAGLALITSAPEKIEVPYDIITDAVASIAGTTFAVNFDSSAYNGVSLLVSATPSLSAGKSNVNSEYRGIGTFVGALGAIEIYDAYIAKFGVPTIGGNVTIKIEPVVATGQKGTAQTVKAVIGA